MQQKTLQIQAGTRFAVAAGVALVLALVAGAASAEGEEVEAEVQVSEEESSTREVLDEIDPFFMESNDESIVFQEIRSVYGVSKFEQDIAEAPSFVTLISADEISKYGYRTLAEVLQSVTGFFVTYDRNYNYLGIRGFNRPGDFNTRVLLLVDGHRLNDNLYDQAGLGTESVIDVDTISRVEVIRGPSSSLYGTNAFFGVINVITKRGRDIRGAEVSAEVGSFDTYRARATYGNKFSNGIEMLVSGSYYESGGQRYLFYDEFNDPSTNNGIVRNADDDRFPSFFGKVSFRDFTFQSGFVSREKGIPTAAYFTTFPTDDTKSLDQHAYAFLNYERQFDSDLNVSGRVYYDYFYYQGDYLYDAETPPPPLVLNRDRSNGEWWGAEAQVGKRLFDSHNVTVGTEFRQNFRQDLWNADVDPKTVYLDDKRETWNVAGYLQDEWSIFDDLILNAGVRFDHYDSFGNTINPRVALIYSRWDTTFKALYGTAFRAPNPYERFYVGTGFKANPHLDPETIATYELVVEHALASYLRGTVTGYYYTIDDLISQELDTSDMSLVFRNSGDVEAMGLEFQLELDESGPYGVSGRLGYALQESVDRETHRRLTNSPTHLVNVNLTAPIFEDKFFGAVEVAYASKRKTLAGHHARARTLTNLTFFTKNLLRGVEISASVRNLFNVGYADPGSGEQVQDQIDQDGRSFWLKLKYGF